VSDQARKFRAFVEAVAKRLDEGEVVYRGSAAERSAASLLADLEEEVLDIAGWGFWFWRGPKRPQGDLEELEQR
jgi:hypothetical protein